MKKQVFKSKVGWWYWLLVLVMLVAFALTVVCAAYWLVPFVCGQCVLLLLDTLFNTKYVVADGMLHVRCGMFYSEKIDVAGIKTVEATCSPISAAALSFDRLRITYGKYGETMVSPNDKTGFIEALKKENGKIIVKA